MVWLVDHPQVANMWIIIIMGLTVPISELAIVISITSQKVQVSGLAFDLTILG